jgi:hypothetical protein
MNQPDEQHNRSSNVRRQAFELHCCSDMSHCSRFGCDVLGHPPPRAVRRTGAPGKVCKNASDRHNSISNHHRVGSHVDLLVEENKDINFHGDGRSAPGRCQNITREPLTFIRAQ